jgi:threonine synthase
MKYTIKCSVCGKVTAQLLGFKCPSCGNPLDLQLRPDFEKSKIHRNEYSIWRYRRFFPYVKREDIITLGEGWTPLVKMSENIYLKLENLNPTGSFKDRGSAVLVSAINRLVIEQKGFLSEDSSGNAGASMAAYAARADLRAKIYVPDTVSGPKFSQVQFYGGDVVKVPGSRSKVAEEAQGPEPGKIYVGHILHPFFRDGIRSLSYEIAEQLRWKAPDYVFVPVSAGTLLLGVISGFRHLKESATIKSIPTIVACQTSQVSPLYHRFKNLRYEPPPVVTSIADALVSANPPLLDLMVKNLKEAQGDAVIVEEPEIMEAFRELAQKGFFVEPSSAVAYAGYKKQLKSGEIQKEAPAVLVLTGMGLKTTLKP